VSDGTVEEDVATAERLMRNHPGFFIGFDLVGQEDLGRPLIDFADTIDGARQRNPGLDFYFHAGISSITHVYVPNIAVRYTKLII